ncbi:hypothetical protein JQC92_06455 [Shewanella sp. 202IG2-18]|uniref:hypothetical protein n=1 Tax=Parashewanella hymeniacidonis TaxID=2807618 RepID=UPI0019610FB6|nr:hypothetical protein [Parashewanella hymeniacidonis]MBM7071682.1 hypothetical protein [Parashewanella hymeniacidonis]
MVSITRTMFTSSEPIIEMGSKRGRNSALQLMISGKSYLIFDDEEEEEKEHQDESSREFFDFHSMAGYFPPIKRRKKNKPNFTVKMGA